MEQRAAALRAGPREVVGGVAGLCGRLVAAGPERREVGLGRGRRGGRVGGVGGDPVVGEGAVGLGGGRTRLVAGSERGDEEERGG